MKKYKMNKGFTIIELIVVIAVLGVLVLLALPKFLGYTEKANVTQVKSDIVAYEKAVDSKRVGNDKYLDSWEKIDVLKMDSLKKSLFNKKGLISGKNEVAFGGEYYKIPKGNELVKTSLKGDFYLGQGGEVYYYDEKLASKVNGGKSESPSEPITPAVPTDKDLGYSNDDFTWVKESSGYIGKNGEKGYFQYTGTGRSIVEIPHVIQDIPMTSYYSMFKNSPVEVVKVVSTNKNVTNMYSMFEESKATTLDLSNFDTSNVTNMDRMFKSSQATTLNLSSFNTSKVTNMMYMFLSSKATTLNLSSFNTSKVTNMRSMFESSQATTLDLSSFNTSKVTNMSSMFSQSKATTLDLSNFDTSNVTDMYSMFWASKATTLNLSNFDTSNVTDMGSMFYNSSATTLNLSSFNTSNVTTMSNMFLSSKATTGYAKTQADADKFNKSSNKPSALTFVVKTP